MGFCPNCAARNVDNSVDGVGKYTILRVLSAFVYANALSAYIQPICMKAVLASVFDGQKNRQTVFRPAVKRDFL